jgi:hypothetical protein
MLMEAVVASFDAPFRNVPEGTVEGHERSSVKTTDIRIEI